MPNLRALLVALTIVAMAIAPVLVSIVGLGSPGGLDALAATLAAPTMQDDDDDDDGNDDEDGNNDGDDGNNDGVDGDDDDGAIVNNNDDDDDNNGNGNRNGNDGGDDDGDDDDGNDRDDGDDDGDDGDDDDGPASPFVPGYTPPAPRAQTADCSTPGRESVFTPSDGTVSVRVFASMPQGVRIIIRKPVDPGSVPTVPGQRVETLLFELVAQSCDGGPLARLPVEANLGVRYTDGDAAGLNEASFKIARLDQGTWKDTEKQAPDPGANYVSATIADLGFYVVHVP